MRHRKHRSKLNRTTEHRRALMRNLAAALIENGRIRTTQPKAAQLQPYIEKLITKAKHGHAATSQVESLHKRRLVLSRLDDKFAAHALFDEIAPRFADRAGGYTRIVRAGFRPGDGAEMAYIEFVDVQDAAEAAPAKEEKSALRRSVDQAKKKAAKK